jgi:CRISPR type I-E-associated protein CasB/Cse2
VTEPTTTATIAPPSEGAAKPKPDPVPARALAWWGRYCEPEHGDPGQRAALRRCRSATDAITIPAAVSLARQVGALRERATDRDRRLHAALNLARVLAHVTQHVPEAPMRAAGWKSFPNDRKESEAGEDRPRLAEARFRRLLQVAGEEEQVVAFTRLVALLDGATNVATLAADFLDWTHPTRGPKVRQRWAFDYFAAGVAAPADPTEHAPTDEDEA